MVAMEAQRKKSRARMSGWEGRERAYRLFGLFDTRLDMWDVSLRVIIDGEGLYLMLANDLKRMLGG